MDIHVIVVDDHSPDDTLSKVRSRFPSIEIIAHDVNRGFAAACNSGLARSDAEFVMLLNSDVVADPGLAERVVGAFDSAPTGTGSVSPMLLASDGTVDSFGITADLTIAGFVRWHGAEPDRVESEEPPLLGPYGAAAAYRRIALDDVGLLDENIFMYGEELDLALRLRSAGWGAEPLEGTGGVHIGGASAGRGSARQRYLAAFGRGYLIRVYDLLRTRHCLRTLAVEAVVIAVGLLRRDLPALRGRVAGWRKGRGVAKRAIPTSGLDTSLGIHTTLQMRRPDYWRNR
jgi:GT2 family glycosyltransferase